MANPNDFVKITSLPNSADIQADLATGHLFQYQKSDGSNFIFNNSQPMYYSAYLEYPAGVIRGNHYHQHKEENLLVLNGELTIKCWLLTTPNEIAEYTLMPGQIINLKPGIAHLCVSPQGASAIEFCPQPLDISDQYNAELLGEISDDDFGFTKSPEKIAENSTQYCVRCLLFNDQDEICVIKSEKYGYQQIPGGRVDANESIIEALKREVHEEAGYEIKEIKSIGYLTEHRYASQNQGATEWVSFAFTAQTGKNVGTQMEDYEKAEGFAPVWLPLSEAIRRQTTAEQSYKDGSNDPSYSGRFASRRDLILLQKYLDENRT